MATRYGDKVKLVALLGCAAAVYLLSAYVWTRWQRNRPDHALTIQPLQIRYRGHDEALQQRTQKRRDAADHIRARAAKVETGESVASVLRVVGKR